MGSGPMLKGNRIRRTAFFLNMERQRKMTAFSSFVTAWVVTMRGRWPVRQCARP